MNPVTLLAIQSGLVSLQVINAGLAGLSHVPGWLSLVVAGIIGGGQFFVQNVGNKTDPNKK